MQTLELQQDTLTQNWSKFLAVWAMGMSVVIVGLVVAILALVMPASQPNPLGETYFELIAAGRAPTLYRAAIMLDVLAWIGWGGLLIAFAGLLNRMAPARSTIISLLASTMSLGFLGACLRIVGTPHLASQYLLAAASQQGVVIQSYDSLLQIINILFSAGGLLGGIALLLIASARRLLPKLPRWSGVLIGVSGAIHMAKGILELATGADFGPVALLGNILLIAALAAVTMRFYRSSNRAIATA